MLGYVQLELTTGRDAGSWAAKRPPGWYGREFRWQAGEARAAAEKRSANPTGTTAQDQDWPL